jgi:hypothetical protein
LGADLDHPKLAEQREYGRSAWTSPKKELSLKINSQRFGRFVETKSPEYFPTNNRESFSGSSYLGSGRAKPPTNGAEIEDEIG